MPPSYKSLALAGVALAAMGTIAYTAYKTLFPKKRSLFNKGEDGIPNHNYYVPYTGPIPDDIDEQFTRVANFVRKSNYTLDLEEQLALYGLFKAATVGHCVGSRPSSLNFEASAKWDAWNECRGLEKDEAKLAYVQLLEKILPSEIFSAAISGDSAALEHNPDDLFMSEEEYQIHRQKIKERVGMGPPTLSTIRGGDGIVDEDDEMNRVVDVQDSSVPMDIRLLEILRLDDPTALIETLSKALKTDDVDAIRETLTGHIIPGRDPILYLAVDLGAKNIVKTLLQKYNVPVHSVNSEGLTLLHMALYIGNEEIAEMLTDAGADPTAFDEDGESSLELYESFPSYEKEQFKNVYDKWKKIIQDKKQQQQDQLDQQMTQVNTTQQTPSHNDENTSTFEFLESADAETVAEIPQTPESITISLDDVVFEKPSAELAHDQDNEKESEDEDVTTEATKTEQHQQNVGDLEINVDSDKVASDFSNISSTPGFETVEAPHSA